MNPPEDRVKRIKDLLSNLKGKLELRGEVIAFIVYGSFSDSTANEPTKYSDVDVEIVVKDEEYEKFLSNFRVWFETNFEPILIETSVEHLQKIFVTKDFVDLQFHLSQLKEFDEIEKRLINYFPNGYTILFDKSGILENKIQSSLKLFQEKTPQQKFDELNNAFWYFVQGTSPYIERREYWFGAAGYWAWLYFILCKILRMYFKKEVAENNPMKQIEQDLNEEIIQRTQPLRNLETPQDLKEKMQLLISVYSEYANKISTEQNLKYDSNIENAVKQQIKQYLEI